METVTGPGAGSGAGSVSFSSSRAYSPDTNSEWNSRTERFCRAWSEQLKSREYTHLEAHQYYKRAHFIVGSIGALVGLSSLFAQINGVLPSDGVAAASASTTGLRIASIVFVAILNAVVAVFLFYKPASLAELHKHAADNYNRLWRRIDLVLLRERALRVAFWPFAQEISEEYERITSEAPMAPHESRITQSAKTITLGIGSIISSSKHRRATAPAAAPATAPAPPPVASPDHPPPPIRLAPPPPEPEPAASDNDSDDDDDTRRREALDLVETIEADNRRHFEKIHKSTRNLARLSLPVVVNRSGNMQDEIALKRRDINSEVAPVRWLKKKFGVAVDED